MKLADSNVTSLLLQWGAIFGFTNLIGLIRFDAKKYENSKAKIQKTEQSEQKLMIENSYTADLDLPSDLRM